MRVHDRQGTKPRTICIPPDEILKGDRRGNEDHCYAEGEYQVRECGEPGLVARRSEIAKFTGGCCVFHVPIAVLFRVLETQ